MFLAEKQHADSRACADPGRFPEGWSSSEQGGGGRAPPTTDGGADQGQAKEAKDEPGEEGRPGGVSPTLSPVTAPVVDDPCVVGSKVLDQHVYPINKEFCSLF